MFGGVDSNFDGETFLVSAIERNVVDVQRFSLKAFNREKYLYFLLQIIENFRVDKDDR